MGTAQPGLPVCISQHPVYFRQEKENERGRFQVCLQLQSLPKVPGPPPHTCLLSGVALPEASLQGLRRLSS